MEYEVPIWLVNSSCTPVAQGVFMSSVYMCSKHISNLRWLSRVCGWAGLKRQACAGSAQGCSRDTVHAEMLNQGPLCYCWHYVSFPNPPPRRALLMIVQHTKTQTLSGRSWVGRIMASTCAVIAANARTARAFDPQLPGPHLERHNFSPHHFTVNV